MLKPSKVAAWMTLNKDCGKKKNWFGGFELREKKGNDEIVSRIGCCNQQY